MISLQTTEEFHNLTNAVNIIHIDQSQLKTAWFQRAKTSQLNLNEQFSLLDQK